MTVLGRNLWSANPLLCRGLGLTGAVALSDTLVKAAAIGAIMFVAALVGAAWMASTRRFVAVELRVLWHLLAAATLLAIVDLVLQAHCHALRAALGVYLPVLVASALLFDCGAGAAEARLPGALARAAAQGGAVLVTVLVLGAVRELAGHGAWLTDVALLTGASGPAPAPPAGLVVATLPAGGLLALAALAAARNAWAGAAHPEQGGAGAPGREPGAR